MLANVLRQFPAFAGLDAPTLDLAARHARLIELPANRWLLRRGTRLERHLYLVEGAVDAVDAQGRRQSVEQEIYRPGDDIALETRAATRVLSVDLAPLRFAQQPAAVPEPQVTAVEGWLDRLLGSPLVRAMPALTWQRLLRGAERLGLAAGDSLVGADAVYLVQSGQVARDGRVFRPGDYFGEELAFAGDDFAARRREYAIVEDAVLLVLPGDAVRGLIEEYPLPERPPPNAQVLDLDRVPVGEVETAARLLREDLPVAIRGGRAGQRAYALVSLTRLGFSAVPVATGPVEAAEERREPVGDRTRGANMPPLPSPRAGGDRRPTGGRRGTADEP